MALPRIEEDEMPKVERYRHGVPSWVDVSTRDVEASAAFYGKLFGWSLGPDLGPEAGGYRMLRKDGLDVAGVGPLMAEDAPPAWSSYINVDDADAACERVGPAGGNLIMGPMDLPNGSGRMALATDPTGGFVGIYQAGTHHGAVLVNETGTLVWNELTVRDPDKALPFYRQVFGWTTSPMVEGESYELIQVNGRTVAGCMPMGPQLPEHVPTHWMVYFAVDDVDATTATCSASGGQVVVPPFETPVGPAAVLNDPSGAVFSIIKLHEIDDPNAWPD